MSLWARLAKRLRLAQSAPEPSLDRLSRGQLSRSCTELTRTTCAFPAALATGLRS
jgi:hypothetical protein